MNDDKAALGRKILRIKKEMGLSWAEVAARLNQKGDRVKVTMSGRFLPRKRY